MTTKTNAPKKIITKGTETAEARLCAAENASMSEGIW